MVFRIPAPSRFITGALAILFLMVSSCTNEAALQQEAVKTYYAGLDAGDFQQVSTAMADSFVVIEGDFVTPQSRADHYTMFQWDSVFAPSYTINKMEAFEDSVKVEVSSFSARYAYLKNNPLTCDMTFSFEGSKIDKLLIGDCPEADWAIWEARRDSMVAWIDSNHAALSGFIFDLTKEGALNYMQAIALYEAYLESEGVAVAP